MGVAIVRHVNDGLELMRLRHVGRVNDGDFNKAVTEVHEEALVRSACNVPATVAVSAYVLNHVVQAERQSPARSSLATTPVMAPLVRPVIAANSLPVTARSQSKSRHL
jgi:hypothetical protein